MLDELESLGALPAGEKNTFLIQGSPKFDDSPARVPSEAEAEAKIQQARQEKRGKDAEELEEANGKAGAPSPGDDPLSPATAANPLKPGQQGQPGGHGTPNTVRPADASRTLNPGSLFNLVA